MIKIAIVKAHPSAINGFFRNKYGKINNTTVVKYAIQVYSDACQAVASSPSAFFDKYSEAHIENEAAIPVTSPDNAISSIFCNANVNPAKTPVSSTKASLSQSTIDPIYSNLFSLRTPISLAS